MLNLPDVTLVMVETREHDLARMAVEDCLAKVEFGDVLILTDEPKHFPFGAARFHLVPDWPDKLGWARAMWHEVPHLMRTSHMLAIQWDSWVVDPGLWRDEFLRFDYVGAPWPFHAVRRVGNSGFCLKSAALARFLADRRDRYPCKTHVEDDLLCRNYRVDLEKAGFSWAPERLAREFSFECEPPRPAFGFHAAFNFPYVCDDAERLRRRVRLMAVSPYVSGGYIFKAFRDKHPRIVEDAAAPLQQQGELLCQASRHFSAKPTSTTR